MDVAKSYTVYVLWSVTGQCHYIGLTEDISVRLTQHNSGISKWTKRYAGSWELIWQEECESLSLARQLESELKRHKGGQGFYARTGLVRSECSSGS